jgi:hypothetical protein
VARSWAPQRVTPGRRRAKAEILPAIHPEPRKITVKDAPTARHMLCPMGTLDPDLPRLDRRLSGGRGKSRPLSCSPPWTWRWRSYYDTRMYRHHILHLGAWLPIILVIAILIFAFEIWMIIDAAINKGITDKARAWWIIGMLIIHPFVAIVYFFTDHRKRKL